MSGIMLNLVGATFGPTPPPTIGQAYAGGFYTGQISTAGTGVADYNLVVGPASSARSIAQWKTSNTSTSGTSSVIDGPSNSTAMNDASHPAAQFCKGLTIGGFSDWYMPAQNELEISYYNLKPTTGANNSPFGVNLNAIPPRGTFYTSGNPAQTSVAIFKSGGAEAFFGATFADQVYWSSTQYSATQAMRQYFGSGGQYYVNKTSNYSVRAIRRVAV